MTLSKFITRKLSLSQNFFQTPKTAVLLLNMGGPNSAEEVRPYLQELFLDEEILKLPVQPLLGRFIAWRRTPAIIKRYEEALGHYSPTDKWFKLQGEALEKKMDEISPLTAPHKCYSAFRYAEPRTPSVVNELREGCHFKLVDFCLPKTHPSLFLKKSGLNQVKTSTKTTIVEKFLNNYLLKINPDTIF